MAETKQQNYILGRPGFEGVMGVVASSEDGEVFLSEGEDIEAFGDILVYFRQMCDKLGESFGLDDLEEGQIIGRSITAVCVAGQNADVGILLNSRSLVNERVRQVVTALSS